MTAASNTPEFTVGELAVALKRTIEDNFGAVRLRGEISNYRGPHSSGHAYFCLKDQTARIDAVVWKSTLARLRVKPEEGLEVIATGKVTTYPGKSAYQIVIESLEPAGLGALMALLEERRRKLAEEGLFDAARKQLIPFLPATIGVVTSPTGAVIRDILHRIADRFPRDVLIWPVRVQGEDCAAEVAAAIEGFNAPDFALRRPDVLIVARGGGSLEDLWGFNEEIVLRAAAASLIPLISAIGHETDWTLLDHVADLRAPTPTGAAEKAVPVRSELIAAIDDLGRRHTAATHRYLAQHRATWRAHGRALPRTDAVLAVPRQTYDRMTTRLANMMTSATDRRHIALARLAHRLASQSPQAKMGRAEQRLDAVTHRLRGAPSLARDRRRQRVAHLEVRLSTALAGRARLEVQTIAVARQRLQGLDVRLQRALSSGRDQRSRQLAAQAQLLASLGYRQVLARGFALVRDERGRPLHRAADVCDGARLDIEFADGHRDATAGEPDAPAATGKSPRPRAKTTQGSLF
jgi:exodeoxyribonuclease VII large subunit